VGNTINEYGIAALQQHNPSCVSFNSTFDFCTFGRFYSLNTERNGMDNRRDQPLASVSETISLLHQKRDLNEGRAISIVRKNARSWSGSL
jgi:hypothetical protein